MRFSFDTSALSAFAGWLVHADGPLEGEERDVHRRFLSASFITSSVILAGSPLLFAAAGSGIVFWGVIAAMAAIPLLAAAVLSLTGSLNTVQTAALLLLAVVFGGLLGLNIASVPAALICGLICLEPLLWKTKNAGLKCASMAVLVLGSAAVSHGSDASQAVARYVEPVSASALWFAALICGSFTVYRLQRMISQTQGLLTCNLKNYDRVTAQSEEMVSVHNRDGLTTFVSPACQKLFGSGAQDLVTNGLVEKIHVQDRIGFLKAISDCWHTHKRQTLRMRVRRQNEGAMAWTWIEANFSAEFSSSGSVSGVIVISRDVTDAVELAEVHAAELERQRQVSEAQKRFLAIMSHELRTPLNAIIGFSDILDHDLIGRLENERHRDYVRHIRTSGQHLLQVVNDLLDMSRIESGRYELEYSDFLLTDLFSNTTEMLQPLAAKAELNLGKVEADNDIQMRGDRRALQQILLNLVSNAIKFTPEGGSVSLVSRRIGQKIQISVRDTGIGIAPEFLAKIGQPFMQAESGTDRHYEGSGLGLSVVRGLAELHGGNLEIESEQGIGTTASVVLPIQPSAARPVPHTQEHLVVGLLENRVAEAEASKEISPVVSKGDKHARLSA